MRLSYPICLYPNDSGYTVIIPDLNGCVTEGKDFADAIYMAIDAASLWVLDELEEGRKPPKASDPSQIKADEYENGIVSVIMLDIDAYSENHGSEPVQIECIVPQWLKTTSDEHNVDYSAVLQAALLEQLNMEA